MSTHFRNGVTHVTIIEEMDVSNGYRTGGYQIHTSSDETIMEHFIKTFQAETEVSVWKPMHFW